MRVVIDTNVLITTVNRRNAEFFIYQSFANQQFEWLVSTEILLEYTEKITAFYSTSTADFILKALCNAPNVVFTEPYFRWNIIQNDPDDNKFADLAICSNADCLITYDKDFNVFKNLDFPQLRIVSPSEFKNLLPK